MLDPTVQPVSVRKRPVAVEAMKYTGENQREIEVWMTESALESAADPDQTTGFRIATLEGTMTANPGDWIIRGIKGEFYPCKPDIFEVTYETGPADA